jgi:hypothetical protein
LLSLFAGSFSKLVARVYDKVVDKGDTSEESNCWQAEDPHWLWEKVLAARHLLLEVGLKIYWLEEIIEGECFIMGLLSFGLIPKG